MFVLVSGFADTTIVQHPNGNWLFSSVFEEFGVWNIETGEKIRSFGDGIDTPGYKVMIFAISPNGKRLIARYNSGIVMWDIEKYVPLWTINDGYTWHGALSFSHDSTKVVYQTYKIIDENSDEDITGNIVILNSENGNVINTLARNVEQLSSLVFNPNGTEVAGGLDNDIKIWNIQTGREIRTLRGHTEPVMSVRYNNNGNNIISGSRDQTVKIWESNTGREIRNISMGFNPRINSVVISPNGKVMAASSGRSNSSIMVWNAETGASTLILPKAWYWDVAFSLDNTRIISQTHGVWGRDTITIWNVSNGNKIKEFVIPNDDER
jgi:WD40 repeat protein